MLSQKMIATRSTISVYSTIPCPLQFKASRFFVERSGLYMRRVSLRGFRLEQALGRPRWLPNTDPKCAGCHRAIGNLRNGNPITGISGFRATRFQAGIRSAFSHTTAALAATRRSTLTCRLGIFGDCQRPLDGIGSPPLVWRFPFTPVAS